jgi:hypothetical protein
MGHELLYSPREESSFSEGQQITVMAHPVQQVYAVSVSIVVKNADGALSTVGIWPQVPGGTKKVFWLPMPMELKMKDQLLSASDKRSNLAPDKIHIVT